MKILWVSHLLPYPPKGGVMQRSYNLLYQVSKDNEVDFIALSQKSHHVRKGASVEVGKDVLGEFCDVIDVMPIKSDSSIFRKHFNIAAGFVAREPYMVWWLRSKEFRKALAVAIEKTDYDVYYFDTLGLAQYYELVAQKNGVKILNHHNIESQLILRRSKKEKNIFKSFYYSVEAAKRQRYEKQMCPLFDHNVAVSELDRKRLEKITGQLSSSVVANGVDIEYFKPSGIEQKRHRIIFIGGLTFYPNIDAIRFILGEVWGLLKEKFPEVEFYIIGRNPPKDILNAAELDPSIVVTGFVEDIRTLIEEATVYVCPITDGGGTRLKILDALAMGKAIVAHPIACEGIDVTDGKDVLFARTPQEYVDCITQLFYDEKLRNRLGENGRELIVYGYSYESIGKSIRHMMTLLLSNKYD